jgi:hypothetical protein
VRRSEEEEKERKDSPADRGQHAVRGKENEGRRGGGEAKLGGDLLQGRNQKRSVWGVWVKKIERSGKKNFTFCCTSFIFSVN